MPLRASGAHHVPIGKCAPTTQSPARENSAHNAMRSQLLWANFPFSISSIGKSEYTPSVTKALACRKKHRVHWLVATVTWVQKPRTKMERKQEKTQMTKQRHGQGSYPISALCKQKGSLFPKSKKASNASPTSFGCQSADWTTDQKRRLSRRISSPRTLHVCFDFKHPLHDGFAIHGVISYDL